MKIKKNIKALVLSTIILANMHIPNVYAAATINDRTLIKINNQIVYKLYDNSYTVDNYKSSADAAKIKLTVDGKSTIGYCVDFGIALGYGDAKITNITEYFAKGISQQKAEKLVQTLTEYLRFGYGSTESKKTDKYYLATQKLIWEAISDSGFYESDFYDEVNGSNSKLKISNFRWTIDDHKTVIDLNTEINEIKKSINNYYQKPSFCSSSEKIEIEVGETAEYTDNNNVLSNYEVACDEGIECTVDGNKLKVKAINEASSNKISFTKIDTNGTDGYVYKSGSGQSVIVESGKLEPVSCQFGIDSFKNEKTADTKMIYIITIGLFGGIMAYIAYYTKKSLEGLE